MPKVWIADDDDAIRTILDEHLKSDGLDVSSFSDGELLLNELDKDVPDLVISDIKMPRHFYVRNYKIRNVFV